MNPGMTVSEIKNLFIDKYDGYEIVFSGEPKLYVLPDGNGRLVYRFYAVLLSGGELAPDYSSYIVDANSGETLYEGSAIQQLESAGEAGKEDEDHQSGDPESVPHRALSVPLRSFEATWTHET